MDSEVKNASDEEQVSAARKKDKRRLRLDQQDMEFLLGHVQFRWFIWNKMSECHLFSTTFTAKGAEATAFNEGQRSIGLGILNAVMEFPEHYLEMQKE